MRAETPTLAPTGPAARGAVARPETPAVSLGEARAACARVAARHYENFPVASILVPAAIRPAVRAVYAFARAADDFADEPEHAGARLERGDTPPSSGSTGAGGRARLPPRVEPTPGWPSASPTACARRRTVPPGCASGRRAST